MSVSCRNFNLLDLSRSNSTSGPASDLPERILQRLDAASPSSEHELIDSVVGEPSDVLVAIQTMIKLKLINNTDAKLQISEAGKIALQSELLSIASSDRI